MCKRTQSSASLIACVQEIATDYVMTATVGGTAHHSRRRTHRAADACQSGWVTRMSARLPSNRSGALRRAQTSCFFTFKYIRIDFGSGLLVSLLVKWKTTSARRRRKQTKKSYSWLTFAKHLVCRLCLNVTHFMAV